MPAPLPVLPHYGGACLTGVIPALLAHRGAGEGWIADDVLDAPQVVVLVLDGLGWEQLGSRRALAPTLAAMPGAPITSVAPSTTAAALTSLTTGTTPGEHGVVGYRIRAGVDVMNALRWTTPIGDVRDTIRPEEFQPVLPFVGTTPPVITRVEFGGSGFTSAHLRGGSLRGYWATSSIAVEARGALDAGARFVYAYYDGIDKIGHAHGFGAHYDAELTDTDRLVAAMIDALPAGAALIVTADHGQVHVGDRVEFLHAETMAAAVAWSGEARFVWLHAKGGREHDLLDAAAAHHGHHAWVLPIEQVIDEAWFGPEVTAAARARLGDVAVVPWEDIALVPPGSPGPPLVGRHGSLTAAEMYVPLLAVVA